MARLWYRKQLNELSQEKVLVHRLEAKVALDLGIPLGTFKIDGSTMRFVQDYAKYREIAYGQTTVLIGVAIRYSVVFRVLNTSDPASEPADHRCCCATGLHRRRERCLMCVG